MNEVPTWVTTSVGIYAILGSVFMVLLILVLAALVVLVLDLTKQVKGLTDKVHTLTDKAQGIADQVSHVTGEVGARAVGIARMADEKTQPALRTLEVVAPVLFIVGAFMRIRNLARGRRRR